MSVVRVYQASLCVAALFSVFHWFFPHLFHLFDFETQQILAAGGYGSILPDWLWSLLFVTYLIASVGMFFFRSWSRPLFAFVMAATVLISPAGGVYVITGVEAVFYDLSMLLKGAVLAIAYLTDLKFQFIERQHQDDSHIRDIS